MNHAGAIASNAGDDFHLIWAAKRIIEMLKPDSELNTVVVEGPAWEDAVKIENQTWLYSIDMTEYYGGDTFEYANRIVFTQLKYSAYHPNQEWNLSKLCSASDKKNSNSVIRRMADTYKAFCQMQGDVSHKMTLKLVSNQNMSSELVASVKECKDIVGKYKYNCIGKWNNCSRRG